MYYFIVNPNSRSGKGAAIWENLEALLESKSVPYRVYFTEYLGHANKLASQITSNKKIEAPINLIAVGGDGTIQEVLTGISDLSAVNFGYIPTGSGNDFSRGMQLPQDPVEALALILRGTNIRNMDVPKITCGNTVSRFAISCGIGFDAGVCHEVGVTPMKKILNKLGLGKLVYLFVALKQLLFSTPCPMTLTLDGDRQYHYNKVYFIAVMNQKYEGGGFKFCPNALPNDRILDIIVVDELSRLKVLGCLPTAFFGKHTHFKGIHILQAKEVDVESSLALPIHKDGEAAGVLPSFHVSLEKQQIKIYLPE